MQVLRLSPVVALKPAYIQRLTPPSLFHPLQCCAAARARSIQVSPPMRTTSRILTNPRKIVLHPVSLIYCPSKSSSSAVRFRRFHHNSFPFSRSPTHWIRRSFVSKQSMRPRIPVSYPISAGLRILSPSRLPGCSLPNYAQSIRCIKAESISGVERASFYNLSQRVGHSDIPLGVLPYF
jgi:hypothetical protein